MSENKENKEIQEVENPSNGEVSSHKLDPTIDIAEQDKKIVVTIKGNSGIVNRDTIHPKFSDANINMLATGNLPYYGEFNLFINFHEANIGTCGVNVSSKGMNFFWNRKWVDSLTKTEANFILIHEDLHLIFDHIKRSVGYDQKLANIAQDMIINQTIYDDIMSSDNLKSFLSIPVDREEFIRFPDGEYLLDENGEKVKNPNYGNNTAMFIPEKYKGSENFEELYFYLVKELEKYKNRKANQNQQCDKNKNQSGQNGQGKGQNSQNKSGNGGDGEGQGDGENSNNQNGQGKGQNKKDKKDKSDQNQQGTCGENGNEPDYGSYGKNGTQMTHLDRIFENLEQSKGQTLDQHLIDEIPDELRKELVKDIMANLKARGLEEGMMSTIINKLRKTKKDYLKEIKRAIAVDILGTTKDKTIVRPNRRNIAGLKGHKKIANKINTILDTSGSMGGEFDKVLSYIFQNDVQINMIQIDTKVQNVQLIKEKKELEKMKIEGLGGTILQPAVDYIADDRNKLNVYNTVILTDGYTDRLDFSRIKGKVLILTTAALCEIVGSNGKVKQIKIDKEEN